MKELKFENKDKLPLMGLGTWLSKSNEVYDAVIEAIKAGYRHIDCAYIYGNEKEIGRALAFAFSSGLVTREEMFITSKLWNSDHAPKRVAMAIDKTLTDLRLEYLDLYLMHWPIAFKGGHEQVKSVSDLVPLDEMPLEVTWDAMIAQKEAGLVRHVGVSNFSISKLQQLLEKSKTKPEVNQVEIHPYFQQNELINFCNANNILVTAYSPLGSKSLMKNDEGIQQDKIIVELAKKHNCSTAQLILAWGLQRGYAVIPKSTNKERIIENIGAFNVRLVDEDRLAIGKLDRKMRIATARYAVLPNGYYTYENIWDE